MYEKKFVLQISFPLYAKNTLICHKINNLAEK